MGSKQVRQTKTLLLVSLSETEKIHFLGGLVSLVAEDSALEDRDLVRRQAGVLARHLQHPDNLPSPDLAPSVVSRDLEQVEANARIIHVYTYILQLLVSCHWHQWGYWTTRC